jgi:sec-independent protein translocase protein TatA
MVANALEPSTASARCLRRPGILWAMPGWIGLPEILLLLLVILLVFGPKRLPEMGRSLGKGMREFKDSVTGRGHDEDDELHELPMPTEETEPVPRRGRKTIS